MLNKKQPLRTCVITKEKLFKRELIRIVKDKDNNISIDLTGKQNGRGIYLKRDIDVILKAQKNKMLDKLLEAKVDDELYVELIRLIKEEK